MCDVGVGTQLSVGVGAGEQFGEHVGVDARGGAVGQHPVFVAITLEDGLDDEFPRVAGHRPLERPKRGRDHRPIS